MCSQTCVYICVSFHSFILRFFLFLRILSSSKRNGWFGVLVFGLCFCAHECDLIFMLLQFLLAGGCSCCCCCCYFFVFFYDSLFGMSLCFQTNEKQNMSSLLAVPYCYSYALANIRLHMYNVQRITDGLVCARCILEISTSPIFGVRFRLCSENDWTICQSFLINLSMNWDPHPTFSLYSDFYGQGVLFDISFLQKHRKVENKLWIG